MAEMKFKFTIQPYQTEAVDSVVNVFAGQSYNDRFTYRRDVDIRRILDPTDGDPLLGFANAKVQLDRGQLLENVRRIQARNNIKLSDKLTVSLGACSLDVEMETGTGKTYVYIKTMVGALDKATSSMISTSSLICSRLALSAIRSYSI